MVRASSPTSTARAAAARWSHWIEAHPGEHPPGIGGPVAFVAAGREQYTDAAPGEELVVCVNEAEAVVLAAVIAVR